MDTKDFSQENYIEKLNETLNKGDHQARMEWLGQVNKNDMINLFEIAKDNLEPEYFVDIKESQLKEKIHFGKNSLPMFNNFQKRFAFSNGGSKTEILGYNHQSMSWITGPGYFNVLSSEDGLSSCVIDYNHIPETTCDSWPSIKDNDGFPRNLVYGGMQDYMKKISDHVSIGRAVIKGKITNNYFILIKE